MEIKVLGSGCAKCNKLTKTAEEVVKELGLEVQVEKVTDMEEIISYGVMSTPALVVNGKVKFSGRVPKKKEVQQALSE